MKALIRNPPVLLAIVALLALAATAAGYTMTAAGAAPPAGADDAARPRRLVFAVDGMGWEMFELARQRGMFRRFAHGGRHVAPYPSMSHPSWNEVVGLPRMFGARGNIRTLEARWFDLEQMRIADDPRQVIAKQTSPYAYGRAWDYFFDPLIEPLMYLRGRKLFDREIRDAERAILGELREGHYLAYIGGTDAMAHTHRNGLWPYLAAIDSLIERVADSLDARGTPAELWLLSDHGNAGGFREGQPETFLTEVSLDAAIRRAGLSRVDTARLERPDQVSVVTIALATMFSVYFADLSRRRDLAVSALAERGVELVTWLEVTPAGRHVVILDAAGGEARLRWTYAPRARPGGAPDSAIAAFSYERVRGNPLRIPDSLSGTPATPRWVPDSVMRVATYAGPWTDAPFRIARSADKQVENAPDLIINLRDGFCARGDLGRFVRMVRTHGSLSERGSSGVIASSTRPVPSHVRSEEVLNVMGFTPEEFFRPARALKAPDPAALAEALLEGDGRVATHRDEQSADMRFLRRARPVTLSMDYFPLSTFHELASALSDTSGARRGARTRDIVKRANVVDGLARNIDTLLSLADSLDPGALPARLDALEERLRGIPELAPLAGLRDAWSGTGQGTGAGQPLRRGAMAAWTLPYYLDAALASPEWDSVPDPRDARFALRWHAGLRDRVAARPDRLLDDTTLAPRLFQQVFAERRLLHAMAPATTPLLYDPDVAATTVVYVPGIYDELFDGEIWSRGLRSVRTRLGARTLTIPVDGRCASGVNAGAIVAALRMDTRRRLERGYPAPRYLIIGYSKGGIDATEALVRAPALAREQVSALVTIATPHRGTPVVERADVPREVMKVAVRRAPRTACDTLTSSESLWPVTRSRFWTAQRDGRDVAPLARFFSLSFVADAAASHPWMKVTKRIGEFREPNDGVVALSSSRFPAGVRATDLGVVAADHIAGRLASDFPQDAFLEAVVVTVAELGALRPEAANDWRQLLAAREGSLWHQLVERFSDTPDGSRVPAFAASLRSPGSLPGGSTGWQPHHTFRMGGADDFADMPVRAMSPALHPQGIRFRCDQKSMAEFRREYEFYYDAGNGGSEDVATNGAAMVPAPGAPPGSAERACVIATRESGMKMTTASFRFRPVDFPLLRLRLRLETNVARVDVGKGGLGKNDAAFKFWLIVRDTRPGAGGRIALLGYVWAAANSQGVVHPEGHLQEARLSRRNLVVTTLPESWLVTIGSPGAERKWTTVERDVAADLARAFPGIPTEALQVVGITFQSDSDESRQASEVYVSSVSLTPRPGNPLALIGAVP